MIYLSVPYSGMEELSFEVSCLMAAFLMKTGAVVLSPIIQGHVLASKYDMPCDHEFWLKHDLEMLKKCDEMYVIALPGWSSPSESKGRSKKRAVSAFRSCLSCFLKPKG